AKFYAQNGFWAKAISINKVILEIDPKDQEIQKSIVSLYSNMGLPTKGKRRNDDAESHDDRALAFDESVDDDLPVSSPTDTDYYYPGIDLSAPKDAGNLKAVIGKAVIAKVKSKPSQEEIVLDLDAEVDDAKAKPAAATAKGFHVPLFSDFSAEE